MTFSSDFDPAAEIRTASRLPKKPKISNAEAKRLAETYLVQPPSAELLKAYRLTATGGVVALMHYQSMLGIAERTVRKYAELGILERLPDRTPKLRDLGFKQPTAALRLYTLGPVGHAMAEQESIIAPSGYHATVDRVTHDLLAAHVVIELLLAARAYGLQWQWHNRYQASVKIGYRKRGLEPDAAILLTNPHLTSQASRLFLLEFHNESRSNRISEKLFRYRSIEYREVEDYTPWWGHDNPTLLVASPHRMLVVGYVLAFRDPDQYYHPPQIGDSKDTAPHLPRMPAYGVALADMKPSAQMWKDLRTAALTDIFAGL